MAKTFKKPIRVALAFFVAAVADGLQFGVSWLTDHWLLPGEIADFGLDLIVAAILSLLLGFHPIFLPSFILKAVQIPFVEEIPTWTACVAFLAWSQKREAANDPQTPNEPEEMPPPKNNPKPAMFSVSTPPTANGAGRSNIWYVVTAVCLVAGLIWFTHRTPKSRFAFPQPVEASSFAPAPFEYSGTNPVVVVGNIENQSAANSQRARGQTTGSPERIRSQIEELIRGIDGAQILERQQAQVFLNQWTENPGGQTAEQIAAKERMTASPIIVVLGAILDLHDDSANFKGYGITARTLDTECSLRIQVMKAGDGSITFSKILTGSKTQTQTDAVQATSTEEPGFEAIKSALRKLENDDDFKDAVRGIRHEQVAVEFAPKPNNCDVEIDGHYIGGSPLVQKCLSNHEIKVRISKAGFRDWEKRFLPQAGLRVTPELEPKTTQKP